MILLGIYSEVELMDKWSLNVILIFEDISYYFLSFLTMLKFLC